LGPLQVAISGIMSVVVYTVILFAVFKIFQISTDLSEIKELLKDIKRNSEDHSPAAISQARSPESLLRAVSATSYTPPDLDAVLRQVPDLPPSTPPASQR
jgi:hypothetical protein